MTEVRVAFGSVTHSPVPVCCYVTELRMTCFGRSFVHWSEVENVGHRGGRQRIETVDYSDNEDYFQYKFCLWQGGGEL